MPHINSLTAGLAVTETTARTTYPAGNTNHVRVYNVSSTVDVYVNSGDVTVTATTANAFVPAGEVVIFEKNANDTHIAAICAGGQTSTILVGNE